MSSTNLPSNENTRNVSIVLPDISHEDARDEDTTNEQIQVKQQHLSIVVPTDDDGGDDEGKNAQLSRNHSTFVSEISDNEEGDEETADEKLNRLIIKTEKSVDDFLKKVFSVSASQSRLDSQEEGMFSPLGLGSLFSGGNGRESMSVSFRSSSCMISLHKNISELNEFAMKFPQGTHAMQGLYSDEDFLEETIDKVAKIPNLLLAVLSLKEKDERIQRQVLSLPIISRVFLNPNSICLQQQPQPQQLDLTSLESPSTVVFNDKDWFTHLLSSKGKEKLSKELHGDNKKIVDYLEIISNLTTRDYVSLSLTEDQLKYGVDIVPTHDEEDVFEKRQKELFDTVSEFSELLIPSLFELSNKEMERVGITLAVQHVLQKNVQRPFIIALVTFDCFFHLVLLMMWRNLILLYFNATKSNASVRETFFDLNWTGRAVTSLGPTAVFYFICRLIGEFAALWQISKTIFWSNLTYRWTILEVAVLFLVLGNIIPFFQIYASNEMLDDTTTEINNAYQVVVIGLLWIRGLGFLQTLRKRLSANILAVFEILRDMFSFMIIAVVIVFGFGDMLFTCYRAFTSDNDVCPSTAETRISPFCSDERWPSYLTVYRVFIGDLSYLDFNANFLTTFLFILLTFFGIVILLNMLIALVTEAYEKSLLRSNHLFARSRIALIAKGIALESAMFPREDLKDFRSGHCLGTALRGLATLLTLATMLFVGTISSVPVYNALKGDIWGGFACIIAAIPVLIIGYIGMVLLGLLWPKIWSKLNLRPYSESALCAPFRFFFTNIVARCSISLLGVGGKHVQRRQRKKTLEWNGRLAYTNKAIHDAVHSAGNATSGGILQIAERLENLEESRKDLKMELQFMEHRLLDALQQLQVNSSTQPLHRGVDAEAWPAPMSPPSRTPP